MFNWLTFRPKGRRASSYELVTTRFSSRRRMAMHVREIVSMLLVAAWSMIVRLPDRQDHCICKYRRKSTPDERDFLLCLSPSSLVSLRSTSTHPWEGRHELGTGTATRQLWRVPLQRLGC